MFLARRFPFDAEVTAEIVVGTIAILFAISLIMFVFVTHEITKREAVVRR